MAGVRLGFVPIDVAERLAGIDHTDGYEMSIRT
jgi:hypothetical protein